MTRSASERSDLTNASLGELIENIDALSSDARRADIQSANRYLASAEGRREFGLLDDVAARSDRV